MATESLQSTKKGDAKFKVSSAGTFAKDTTQAIKNGGKGAGSVDTPSGGKTNKGLLAHGWSEEKIANQKRG
jgi:phage antirepressor YoqD-like protein